MIWGSDELQKTPERIEAYIQGKYFVTCVSTLNSALKKLDGGECTDIGALANVKQELFAFKNVRCHCGRSLERIS
jgi:hypothetical protein